MANNQFVVIGIGQFGEAIARTLSKNGAEVMAIDIDEDRIDAISKDVAYAVALDASDKNALLSQDIQNFDAVVIAIGQDLEQLLLCAVNLIELKVKRIIVRAKNNVAKKILQKLGLSEIFSPEIEVGGLVAEKLLHPNIISFLQLPDNYQVAELKPPAKTIGQTIEARRKWIALMRTYFKMGGAQIQPTIASVETLREAQCEPEKHRDLIVKVGGYSTYFVDLGCEIQNEIIARTEHGATN